MLWLKPETNWTDSRMFKKKAMTERMPLTGRGKKMKKERKKWFLNGCNNSLILKYHVKLRHTCIRVFLIFHRSEKYKSNLSLLQETVREFEVCQIALGCIKNGESPVMNGKYILYFLNMLAPASNGK